MLTLTELLTPRSQTRGTPTLNGASEGAPVNQGLWVSALDSVGGLVRAFRGEPANVQANAAAARQPLENAQAEGQRRSFIVILVGVVLAIVALIFLLRK